MTQYNIQHSYIFHLCAPGKIFESTNFFIPIRTRRKEVFQMAAITPTTAGEICVYTSATDQAEVRSLHSTLALVAFRAECRPHSHQKLGEALEAPKSNSICEFCVLDIIRCLSNVSCLRATQWTFYRTNVTYKRTVHLIANDYRSLCTLVVPEILLTVSDIDALSSQILKRLLIAVIQHKVIWL